VPVEDQSGRYAGLGELWAEPDLDHAAAEMRRLAADPALWAALSSAGLAIGRDRLAQPIPVSSLRRFLAPAEAAVAPDEHESA
jgi:hypothetical protein